MIALDPTHLASRHYFERDFHLAAVKLLPGEYYVTSKNIVLTTVLGSCVSACVRDCTSGIGGMNHFMLPDEADLASGDASATLRYGAHAMEVLLSELIKAGARRERLEAKVFGGGAMLANMTQLNIGQRNAEFVLRYLKMEKVRIAAQDLRGNLARRINFFPLTGRVAVRRLGREDDALQVQFQEQELVGTMLKEPVHHRAGLSDVGIPRTVKSLSISRL